MCVGVCGSLFADCCWLSIVCCMVCARMCCLLRCVVCRCSSCVAVGCLLCDVSCSLFVVRSLSCAVCCLMCVVYCVLIVLSVVGRWPLFVVGCVCVV